MANSTANKQQAAQPTNHRLLATSIRKPSLRKARTKTAPTNNVNYFMATLLTLFSILCFLSIGANSQSNAGSGDGNVVIPCANNLTCPSNLMCYLASTGLTCQPADTIGCRALPLPSGNYYTGPIVNIGSACQRCPLPGSTAQMQLIVDRYQQAVPGRLVRATLNGLGNCGPDAYCDDAQACRWRKKVLSQCDSSEQCLGLCVRDEEAGYPTCFDPQNPRAEAIQRLMYFGIFFGISVVLLLVAALACGLAGQTRQRKEFRTCFVITVLLALALMGVAVYWEASPWPFSA
ncbi:hypothetical protein BDF19DRAFT_426178 [Syncephalis fuscata]|nr:hypothetical protein BDF19DRAFT_426178 [Syncephalis fuscata]